MLYRGHLIVLSSQLNELTFVVIYGGHEVLSRMPFGSFDEIFQQQV